MTYRRVIPRDLFNEAKLLKCLGQLWIAFEDRPHEVAVEFSDAVDADRGFTVHQASDDGSLSCTSVNVIVRGEIVPHYTPLNSRDPYPLYLVLQGEDVRALNADGSIHEDLRAAL